MIKVIRFSMCLIAIFVTSTSKAAAAELKLSRGWHLMHFNQPTVIRNKGTKIIVEYVVNPNTRRWNVVWGEKPWADTWVAEYMKFDSTSDNIHNSGSLHILKPISIALYIFGDGTTVIETDVLPATHFVRKEGPEENALVEKTLAAEADAPKPTNSIIQKESEQAVGDNRQERP